MHRGTNPNRTWYPNPDYDYIAQIEAVSLPAGVIMQIDDPDEILGKSGKSGDREIWREIWGNLGEIWKSGEIWGHHTNF